MRWAKIEAHLDRGLALFSVFVDVASAAVVELLSFEFWSVTSPYVAALPKGSDSCSSSPSSIGA